MHFSISIMTEWRYVMEQHKIIDEVKLYKAQTMIGLVLESGMLSADE